jgi:tRNA G18 (ribose-2'-O)-methylase SpoU
MNVLDSLKDYSVPDIAKYCSENSIPASVAMINIEGDFNLSTMVRNANFLDFVVFIMLEKRNGIKEVV